MGQASCQMGVACHAVLAFSQARDSSGAGTRRFKQRSIVLLGSHQSEDTNHDYLVDYSLTGTPELVLIVVSSVSENIKLPLDCASLNLLSTAVGSGDSRSNFI
jgi:hypothetical protein